MRLTQVDYGSAKTVEYTLDALGNRSAEVQTIRPTTGANVITTWSSTFDAFNELKTRSRSGGGLPALNATLAYDFNGNTLSETTASPGSITSYMWDRDNRLRAVTPPAPGVPTSYSYDANGLRVQCVDASGTVNYLLDGPRVLAELDAAAGTATRFLNNPQQLDEVISFERGGSTYCPLTDALGSIYAVADASGAVVHRYNFDVYGVRTDLGGNVGTLDAGYTGRWHDVDGLIDHRLRQRRADLGGWLQPDRLSSAVQMGPRSERNVYNFARNAPTALTDPSGLCAVNPGSKVSQCVEEYLGQIVGMSLIVATVPAIVWFLTQLIAGAQGVVAAATTISLGVVMDVVLIGLLTAVTGFALAAIVYYSVSLIMAVYFCSIEARIDEAEEF